MEIKINRKTAFGTATLVLTDFAGKDILLERNRSESQTPDGGSLHDPSRNDFNSTNHYEVNSSIPFPHQCNSLKPASKKQKIDCSTSSVGRLTEKFVNRFVNFNYILRGKIVHMKNCLYYIFALKCAMLLIFWQITVHETTLSAAVS